MAKFVHLHSSIRTFFEWAGRKIFLTLLGYIVAKACASPRNSTWFTRPFLLVRGWGLGTRLVSSMASLVLGARNQTKEWPEDKTAGLGTRLLFVENVMAEDSVI